MGQSHDFRHGDVVHTITAAGARAVAEEAPKMKVTKHAVRVDGVDRIFPVIGFMEAMTGLSLGTRRCIDLLDKLDGVTTGTRDDFETGDEVGV